MSNTNILMKKVNELESLADEIHQLASDLLQYLSFNSYGLLEGLPLEDVSAKEKQRNAIRKYQLWFASAKSLIATYAPEWENDFSKGYVEINSHKGVLDFLSFNPNMRMGSMVKLDDLIGAFNSKFETQIAILLSIPAVAELKELDLRKIIAADVARTEIEQAEILLANGFERAAGSIAGVALELHLKTFCDIHSVSYAPKATIQPLIQTLQKAGKLDITEAKHIEYLASIRNKCSHTNNVTEAEIKALIEGLKKLI